MSVTVELQQLDERVREFGPVAFVTTIGDDGRPHVVSTGVELKDGVLHAGAGRTTSANATARPGLSVLWPAVASGEYCLIVDGAGVVQAGGADEPRLLITPSRAVLHRLAGAPGEGPSCVTILDQRR